ncbi:putative ribonuclease C609,01 [Talaromyces islandicus]|uniref:Putative ribonuclease C609,01 n=1 Tax=Talaromyces islandicus TaxID=28573 RepID=A0A0U1LXQ9_TALIS|nr:putative ribonuclease C609,01 [Talaromyces islandicus]
MHEADSNPTLAVVNLDHASQTLVNLCAAFSSASGQLDDLASSMKTLCKTFDRLRLSLQQTNKPFEGYDGFEKTLRNCDIFVRSFQPVKAGKPWTCSTDSVSQLEAQIMMQIALLSTTHIVLLAETFFVGESDTIDEITQPAFVKVDHSTDEHDLELWEKIQRLIYRRKRRPVSESKYSVAPAMDFQGLEKEVQNQVRRLMLNHQPSLPRRSASWTSHHPLDLSSLSDEALLERAQQQRRFLLSASRQNIFRQPSHIRSRTNTTQDDLDGVVKQQKRNQLLGDGTVSFSLAPRHFRYALAKIEARLVDRKRIIHCTSTDDDIFIVHDLPTKLKRHPITDHPEIGSTTEVYFSELLHVDVKSRFEKIASGDTYIYYKFNEPYSICQFQEIVRDKDLLHTFCVSQVNSANGKQASYQHLKIWRDRQTQACSASFLRNAAAVDQTYVEFPLSMLTVNLAKRQKDSRTVQVDFLQDSASTSWRFSMDHNGSTRRLSGASSVASVRTDMTNATVKHTEKIQSLAASMAFLLIKFTNPKDIETFCSALAHLQSDPPSPLTKPTNTPPLCQRGFATSVSEDEYPMKPYFSSPPGSISGMSLMTSHRRTTYQDYTVGWIAALPIEMKAAILMLDELHAKLPQQYSQDNNAYVLGRVANHNVALACLPAGYIGNNSAAVVATQMAFTFPNINIRLMVGIGGGVPGDNNDIRLGDVVVSKPGPHDGGVVQYDFGKTTVGGFEQTGSLPPPPARLLTATSLLEALHSNESDPITDRLEIFQQRPEFRYPGAANDQLFLSDYDHVANQPTCASCDPDKVVQRPPRQGRTRIHYGTIASGNQVMKDARTRDALRQKHGALCFEMEAAGLMHLNTFPCVVIRGICDYSDGHKNKQWQGYAAAAAVAYAKELLEHVSPVHVNDNDHRFFHNERNVYGRVDSVG